MGAAVNVERVSYQVLLDLPWDHCEIVKMVEVMENGENDGK